MAGDWIKVRGSLRKDPRVLAMADYLAEQREFMDWLTDPVRVTCNETAYEHVTRDVTVRVTCYALVETWCAANEAGKADGDDLVMPHCTLDALDQMAEIPGFGRAMAYVDWAIEEKDERGRPRVRLPKFLIHNTPAAERRATSAAERQRRYRQRKAQEASPSDVTRDVTRNKRRDVTVTPREEKRREDINSLSGALAPVPDDWQPSPETIAYAGIHSLPHSDLVVQKFKDHFRETGKLTADPDASYRKWLANERKPGGNGNGTNRKSRFEASGERLDEFERAALADLYAGNAG